MDAKALFTSLEAKKSSELVCEETLNSVVKFDNVDLEELGMYLRKNLSEDYIKANNLDDLLPKRVAKKIIEIYKDKENDAYY